jgi:hypothetical protein
VWFSAPRTLRACALLAAFFLFCAPAASGEPAADDAAVTGPTVEVASRSDVTVIGRFESLWALVEDLCEKSGVTLRTYTAPDRAIVAHYEHMPLRDVLERLLNRESFVLGLTKPTGAPRARIGWLRVVASRAKRDDVVGGANLPRLAFTSPHESVRRRATLSFASRLVRNAEFRGEFLRAGDRRLLRLLKGGRYAGDFLRELNYQVAGDWRLRAKVSSLLRQLEEN